MTKKGYIYFVSNWNDNILYIGVTNSLVRRAGEHNEHHGSEFTSKYNCTKLVYYEVFPTIEQAVAREKQLKHFKREWKNQLVESINPDWKDLGNELTVDPE